MSIFRLFIIVCLAICVSCGSEAEKGDATTASADNLPAATPANNQSESLVKNINLPEGQATPAQKPKEPAQNAAGVWHYTCAKGCPGGGGAATKCATCGDLLKHNSAYHAQTAQPTIQSQPNVKIDPNAGSPVQIAPPTNRPVEPAQNAAGVWHFTCPKGCAGGGGAKGAKCGSCGGDLAHNAAYHNN